MHEAFLFLSLLKEIESSLKSYQPCRVKKIKLLVGVYSGIEMDYLQRVIETLKEGTFLEETEIVTERDPLRVFCPACGKEEICSHSQAKCPLCGSYTVEIRGGLDLILQTLEIEREEEEGNEDRADYR